MQDLPAADILPPRTGLQDAPDRAPAPGPAPTPVPPATSPAMSPATSPPVAMGPERIDHGMPTIDRRRRRAGLNRAFRAVKAQHAAKRTLVENVADRLTGVASSTPFLLLHLVWFGGWIIWNSGLTPLRPFDPYPFGFLTMVVSLEAIFLSIFVLMSQNRESAIAELREEVMLQVNLRMEEELTKTLQLLAGLYGRLGYKVGEDAELLEMLQPLDAHALEKELAEQIREIDGKAKEERRDRGDYAQDTGDRRQGTG
jgi:uncharacterized membrane protein